MLEPSRPPEELYDLERDPHELNNLAGQPDQAARLEQMRQRLAKWELETNDHGRQPESDKMFASDMAVYVNTVRLKQGAERLRVIQSNIDQMKRWAKEGK